MGRIFETTSKIAPRMMLDSNILIGYLNGDAAIIEKTQNWRSAGTVLFVSHVSVIEALSLPALSVEQVIEIERFLNDFIVIPIDMVISRKAAELRRLHALSVPDAVVAASAMVNRLRLVTRDKKLSKLFSAVLI